MRVKVRVRVGARVRVRVRVRVRGRGRGRGIGVEWRGLAAMLRRDARGHTQLDQLAQHLP